MQPFDIRLWGDSRQGVVDSLVRAGFRFRLGPRGVLGAKSEPLLPWRGPRPYDGWTRNRLLSVASREPTWRGR